MQVRLQIIRLFKKKKQVVLGNLSISHQKHNLPLSSMTKVFSKEIPIFMQAIQNSIYKIRILIALCQEN